MKENTVERAIKVKRALLSERHHGHGARRAASEVEFKKFYDGARAHRGCGAPQERVVARRKKEFGRDEEFTFLIPTVKFRRIMRRFLETP